MAKLSSLLSLQFRKRRPRIHVGLLFTALALGSISIISTFVVPSDKLIVSQTTNGTRITIWHTPSGCAAKYSTEAAPDSNDHFPYAVLRDAVVDRRPAAWKELGKKDLPGTERIVLYVTAHLSARLTREGATVHVGNAVVGNVEYVTHSTKFLVRGDYKPGKKTVFGREVSEWQVGLKLEPREARDLNAKSLVMRAVKEGQLLNVTLSIRRYDGHMLPFNIRMKLNCILGWEKVEGGGSALFSGSALYGDKRRNRESYREVGNFAARGLAGAVRYDLVVMSVVSVWSGEDIWSKCRGEHLCARKMEEENWKVMEEVGEVVEEEFRKIGVDHGNVLLVPSCRLGSATEGGEAGDCCKKSKRYGQYFATFYTYAPVGGSFKWAVSHDMDEFLAPSVGSGIKTPIKAELVLEAANRALRGEGHLVMQWLNFRLGNVDDATKLSKVVVSGETVRLRDRSNETQSERCYYKLGDPTGKSAVRRDVGLGFTIHHPVVVVKGKGLMEQRQGNRMYYGLRTWHARLRSSKGNCDFVASRPQP